MRLRAFRERVLQAVLLEAGAIAVIAPGYARVTGLGTQESALLLVGLAGVVMVYSPLYCHLFDLIDWRLTRRSASERRDASRVVHAVGLELSAMAITVPLVSMVGGMTILDAGVIGLGLSAVYAVWTWAFFRAWDRVRPIASEKVPSTKGDRDRPGDIGRPDPDVA